MTNLTSFQYGSKICHLPKALVNNEEFMKEVVSANVWNNKLKKSDKVNLLKFLPTFSQNDTHEKKETLKKLFLGKPINFENQIKKFVHCAKEGDFSASVKSQRVLNMLLSERKSRLTLLKRRINDLNKIIDTKRKMGIDISSEELLCLEQHSHFLAYDDPLEPAVNARLTRIMERITTDGDVAKKRDLYREYNENVVLAGNTAHHLLCLEEVVNRCQNDGEITAEETVSMTTTGPMTRKRRQLQNGFEASLSKTARMKWDRESSDSQSDSSENAKSDNSGGGIGGGGGDSISSGTDSVISSSQRRIRNHRHERREFRCPQEDFPDFFSLLQRLFLGAHQQRLTTAQVEDRLRHWQIVNQRQAGSDGNRWASGCSDWVAVAVSALSCLAEHGIVEHRARGQLWRWRGAQTGAGLHQLYQEWRHSDWQHCLRQAGPSLPQTQVGTDHISPPLFPTSWQMRTSTVEERARFQIQERRRFSRPYRGFTYNVHGFPCVVSPIRGCLPGRDYSGVRARGHPLLLGDRPPHVNIVEIVRDAVARLPNGQGSRADIVSLAMDSAFWTDPVGNEKSIGQCISSALDRLQGEGCDPSVKYNSRLKLWFYRHRGRSVQELEEMHMKNCQEEMRRSSRGPSSGAALYAANGVTARQVVVSQPPTLPVLVPHFYGPSPLAGGLEVGRVIGPSRPSYQQFSRAVTTARDSIGLPLRTHPLFSAPAAASSASAVSREYFAQHPHHFNY